MSPRSAGVLAASLLVAGARALGAQPPSAPGSRDSVVSLYCAAWSAADRAERDRLLERVWAPDGTYLDQGNTRTEGRAALSDAIGRMLQRYPGAHFRCSGAHTHHDVMRFAWVVLGGDGKQLLDGMDFAELAPDGRIRRIVGFFGPLPSAAP